MGRNIWKEKVKRRIKDKDALKIIFDIIDSNENGLYIGSMTSQVLAIFYLNDLDHFIKEKLKIKYYVRYQDDFLLFHHSKKYLNFCLDEIKKFLKKEKLVLNKKTRIYANKLLKSWFSLFAKKKRPQPLKIVLNQTPLRNKPTSKFDYLLLFYS